MLSEEEIKKLVMERYPITELERRGCQTEKFFRKMMRKEYREKLLNEQSAKTGIQ